MEVLRCTRCGNYKPATREAFPPHPGKRNGLDSWCRFCRSQYKIETARGKYRNSISDEKLKELKHEIAACAICGVKTKLFVDHDHKSEKVRGLLCNHCNLGLGHFRDSPLLLEFARAYLLAQTSELGWSEFFVRLKALKQVLEN